VSTGEKPTKHENERQRAKTKRRQTDEAETRNASDRKRTNDPPARSDEL
jgi:hypothetical protein